MTDSKVEISFKGNDLFLKHEKTDIIKTINSNFESHWDEKQNGLRARPIDFWEIKELLEDFNVSVECNFRTDFSLKIELESLFTTRAYQYEAYQNWIDHENQGIVILPTGAGKTFLGIFAIAELNQTTLIIVPTLELMDQWLKRLRTTLKTQAKSKSHLDQYIGCFGGGKKEICPITITTYDSAYLYLHKFRSKFGLLIFDEIHHLSGKKYRLIAEGSISPNRLGLTATLKTKTEEYEVIKNIVGKIIYQKKPAELTKLGQLASYKVKQIKVALEPEILEIYKREQQIFLKYLKRFTHAKDPFKQVLYRVNTDKNAKKALEAYRTAKNIAFNSEKKLDTVKDILEQHKSNDEKILLFSEHIAFVEKLSRRFFIPALTSNTPRTERTKIMSNFRQGTFRILASGKILDEGVDVPDASIGIIISGTGTERQFIQRLGRLLRPLPGKQAILYEIVSSGTSEIRLSSKRTRWRK